MRPAHAPSQVGDGAAVDAQPHGYFTRRVQPQQGGDRPLTRGPAPVQRRVVPGQSLDGCREPPESEHELALLGLLERRPGGVKAGTVELGGGAPGCETGGEGSQAAGDDPGELGEGRAQGMPDRPDGLGVLEQPFQLVSRGQGEAGGEGGMPAAVAVQGLDGVPEPLLQPLAPGRGQNPGGRDVGDQGDVLS